MHLARLDCHMLLRLALLFGLLALHFSHLSLKTVLRRLWKLVQSDRRVLGELKQFALLEAGRATAVRVIDPLLDQTCLIVYADVRVRDQALRQVSTLSVTDKDLTRLVPLVI